jgi:hypothetical protein
VTGVRFFDLEILFFGLQVTFHDPRGTISDLQVTILDLQVTLLDPQVTMLDLQVTVLDLQVTVLDLQVTVLDPQVTMLDLQVAVLDLQVAVLDLQVAVLDLQVAVLDLQVAMLDLRVTILDPQVAFPDPRIIFSDLGVMVSDPRVLFIAGVTPSPICGTGAIRIVPGKRGSRRGGAMPPSPVWSPGTRYGSRTVPRDGRFPRRSLTACAAARSRRAARLPARACTSRARGKVLSPGRWNAPQGRALNSLAFQRQVERPYRFQTPKGWPILENRPAFQGLG